MWEGRGGIDGMLRCSVLLNLKVRSNMLTSDGM